ncbi:MAG: ABC transporter permease [Spirochaetales bacterium]|nr:ABC transporter permease [Spirochaetales bacterium]
MKFLISLAWKNLSRYRRRTIITAVAIAIGIALYIWIDALLLGAEMETVRNLIYFETGPARIMQKKYWEEKDYMLISYYLEDPAAIQAELKKEGYESTQRISFLGNIMNLEQQEGSFQIKMAAIDAKTDGVVFKLEDGIVPENGRFLESGEPEIIIGKDLAEDLDIKLDDWVLVTTKTAGDVYGEAGSWDDLELKVVGLLSTPNPLINKGMAFIPLDYAKQRLMRGQGATDVIVNFPAGADSGSEVEKIKAAIAGLPGAGDWEVLDYKELAREFIMLASTKSGGSKIILFLFFIIAVIGISNTMLMAVFERVKEIGMMRAMGMKDRAIVWAFFLEATGIGFVGSLVGLVLGILLTAYMVIWGLDFSGMIQGMGNIGYRTAGVFKGWWNFDTMLSAFFMGIIISGLVSFIPALRAVRMQITECLRDK